MDVDCDPDFNAPSLDLHVIDQLLLAIIDGYPHRGDPKSAQWMLDRSTRLDQARKALFNERIGFGGKPTDDTKILRVMADLHLRDLSLQAARKRNPKYLPSIEFKKPRSDRSLAAIATKRILGRDDESTEERVRKKFRTQRGRLLEISANQDDIEVQIERNALTKALAALKRLGINYAEPEL